jgi:hypothetical protein
MFTNVTSTSNKKTNTTELTQVMNNISNNVNLKSAKEGLKLLDNPDKLVGLMQSGAEQFKEQTGRNMTYSEMRQMYG